MQQSPDLPQGTADNRRSLFLRDEPAVEPRSSATQRRRPTGGPPCATGVAGKAWGRARARGTAGIQWGPARGLAAATGGAAVGGPGREFGVFEKSGCVEKWGCVEKSGVVEQHLADTAVFGSWTGVADLIWATRFGAAANAARGSAARPRASAGGLPRAASAALGDRRGRGHSPCLRDLCREWARTVGDPGSPGGNRSIGQHPRWKVQDWPLTGPRAVWDVGRLAGGDVLASAIRGLHRNPRLWTGDLRPRCTHALAL